VDLAAENLKVIKNIFCLFEKALNFLDRTLTDYTCYMVPELPTLTVQGGGMINIMNMTFE
jgi:hypothetical protein